MPEENKQKNNYIYCPVCEGHGKNKTGFACANCKGMGLGTFLHGRFFFWGPKLGKAVIELDHIRKKVYLIINFISFSACLLGLLSLAWWLYSTSQHAYVIEDYAFWIVKDYFILFFWIGLMSGLFAYYRLSEEEKHKHRIKNLTYNEKIRQLQTPNNWEELIKYSKKLRIDVSAGFTDQATEVVEQAFLLAEKLNHKHVSPLHLFYASLSDVQVAAIFSRLNVDSQKLFDLLKASIEKLPQSSEYTRISRTVKEILISAYLEANNLGQKKVTAKNFLLSILDKDKQIKEILLELEIDRNKIFNVILWFIINEKQIESYRKYKQLAQYKPSGNMDRAYTSVATPLLNQIGYDLTAAAKWGKLDYCVAREKEISQIWQHLESGVTGILLVGPDGVGKEAVIDGIAQLMVREDVPPFLQDKRLVELDAARLISGASPSVAQGRLMAIIDEVVRAGNITLFVNNIENLIGITSGDEESLDLSEVLASALDKRLLFVFGTVSRRNYAKYVEEKSLGKVMEKVEVNEPKGNQAIQIIESKISHFEAKYRVYFSYNAIENVIKLSDRYIHDRYLPEKAIKILELVAVKTSKEKGPESMVTQDDIAAVVSDITNIPVSKVGKAESEQLLNLENKIHERMINQKEAVKMVSASLRRARTELREGKRPIANFLFLGPTGVGKTELAKSVADVYFGDENYMIRVDMSEYQHQDSIKKLIGDAGGAKGYLTEAVRKSPFSLVLLDEIEKAHRDILNVFLQVMDDGRLTDGQGLTIDFTSSIIIATSNAGALYIQEQIFKGTNMEDIRRVLINEHLNKVMRPELINRFDGVIVFEPLSQENVIDIARLMLNKISRMLEQKGIGMEVSEPGLKILAREGYDPKFGARPLRRLLQDKIEDEIANSILAGKLKRRDIVIIDEKAKVQVQKGPAL